MNSETKMMNIEIQFVGQGNSIIKVREVGKQLWDDIGIKDYHPPCGYDFQELKEVGEGIHEVKVQPNR